MSADSAQTAQASSDLSQTMTHLSKKMQVPLDRIHEIYAGEVNRLAAEARIHQFVSILAIGRTRTILRESRTGYIQS
jgi:hypothetical protein